MMFESRHRRFLAEINVIPLVDVVLVLLVIFMVTAPMLHRGLDLTLPQSSSNTIKSGERLVVTIERDQRLYLEDDQISVGQLERRLREAKAKNAESTVSGLVYIPVEEGSGEHPAATDTVTVHYHGTLRDGSVFDSSRERGQPFVTPLNRVIPCWTEGVQKMKVGGKAKLVCPPEVAYGERGAPPRIPANATLHFEVELIDVAEAPARR